MNHSFNVEIAEKYGIEKAVLLENFYFWIKKNKANKKNLHEGRCYTYNTAEAFAELFPYIKERRIAQLLREMENEDNLLLSGQFFNYDRTKSYTLTDFALSFFEPSNIQNFDNGIYENLTKEDTETGDCLNTDIKPDVKTTDINTYTKTKKHKNGTYQNVLLSDKEIENLNEELGTEKAKAVIDNFSELKEMKGYKYKSDYLAIKKWGIEAYNKNCKPVHKEQYTDEEYKAGSMDPDKESF